MLPFAFADAPFRLNWTIPLNLLKNRALNVNTASPRYRNAERSPFRERALGNKLNSKERFSQAPNAVLEIPKYDSENPQMRFVNPHVRFWKNYKRSRQTFHLWA